MPSIHLLVKKENRSTLTTTEVGSNIVESRAWQLTEQQAKDLVGANVYFHHFQNDRSFYGGVILDIFPWMIENIHVDRRYIIKFRYEKICRDVMPPKQNWTSFEKCIIP